MTDSARSRKGIRIGEVKIGDRTVAFHSYKTATGRIYVYASACVQSQQRSKYIGTCLPSEDDQLAIANSLLVSREEWNNRPKKADRRPKKLDAPDPKLFPPEQYPHLYEPGAVDAIRVKRLTSECGTLKEKNKELERRLRESQMEIQKLLEQVRALEVMGDMQARQISRLTQELQ